MNENHTAYRIRQHLNHGLALEKNTLELLRAGRERALDRQTLASRAAQPAWAGTIHGYFAAPQSVIQRFVLPVAVLVISLLAINTWQQTQAVQEIYRLTPIWTTDSTHG